MQEWVFLYHDLSFSCSVRRFHNFTPTQYVLPWYLVQLSFGIWRSYLRVLFKLCTCGWYTDWLKAGWMRGQSLSPGSVKNFLLSTLSKLVLGSTPTPIQLVPGVKWLEREVVHSPPTSSWSQENVDLIHPLPIRLRGGSEAQGQLYLFLYL
jgi:hypothetical protein